MGGISILAKRKLATVVNEKSGRDAYLELAETQIEGTSRTSSNVTSKPTDKMSFSCLKEERERLEDRATYFRRELGRRDLKPSRLVRIGLKLLEEATDDEVIAMAQQVEYLEIRRVKTAEK